MSARDPFEFFLNHDAILWCALAGCQRQIYARANVLENAHGFKGDDWGANIDGCIGEYVVALHLNVVWQGKGKFRGPDVGVDEQVRMTRHHNGMLLTHKERDADTSRFWLVTGGPFRYRVRGWAWGHEAKVNWGPMPDNPNRPCFRLEQRYLRPPTTTDSVDLVHRVRGAIITEGTPTT